MGSAVFGTGGNDAKISGAVSGAIGTRQIALRDGSTTARPASLPTSP